MPGLWKTGFIIAGLMGFSQIDLFCVQYKNEVSHYTIEAPGLFGPMIWRDVIYASRIQGLKAMRDRLQVRVDDVIKLIEEQEGES